MTFAEAIKTCLFRKYATFSGRASRSEYWWFMLFIWIFSELPLQFTGSLSEESWVVMAVRLPIGVVWAVVVVPIIFAVALLLPNLAVTCRRLHDIGRSGWWSLVILLSLLLDIIGELSGYERDFRMLSAVPMVVLLLFLLRKGTNSPNRFGAPPETGFIP